MKPQLCCLLLVFGCSAGAAAPSGADAAAQQDAPPPADAPGAPDGAPDRLADFAADAARSVCQALFRCCGAADVAGYFDPYRASDLLASFRDRLPPADEPSCEDVLAQMMAIAPFGDWIAAARRGDVELDAPAFDACRAALDGASCGARLGAALDDSTCFAFAAPAGGAEQRAMFHRRATTGASCSPIRDGIGATFFGTCDPQRSFCCYVDPAHPGDGCAFPFGAGGSARAGTCAPASAEGARCSETPPLSICATGLSCDADSRSCVAPRTTMLDNGQPCIDSSFNSLGQCTQGFCDILGSGLCTPRHADGAACTTGDECSSGACTNQRCAPDTRCQGTTTADAGVIDAAPDGAAGAPGETCTSATDLLAASGPSALPGYDHALGGAFGTRNDYNPYRSAMPQLPPACSPVYDAAGAEVVYRLTLAPGSRLRLRYAVQPDSIPGALYLLDSCTPVVTWPDYDGSGACGSNEYASQGSCGIGGCDPIVFDFTYPTALGGVATQPREFYVVLDHLGATPAASWQLDWKVVP